jgi:iron complex transport system substrate-binding protein
VTVENCGVTTTYSAAPQRAVAVEQSAIETMLALGLERSIVGISSRNQTDIRPDLAPAYRALPVLSARDFNRELLLSVSPDIMVSRQRSSFREDRGLSRESLRQSGIESHVLGQDCIAGAPTWDAVYAEIQGLARVFGVTGRADQVVAEMRAAVADVEARVTARGQGARPRVFLYDDSGEDVPGTRGGDALDTLLLRTAGADNVFGDMSGIFGNVSWEELVSRNPDIVVVIEYGTGSGFEAQPRIDRLREHPAARTITAVRENRIVVVPNHQVLLGVRNVEALHTIAKAVHPGAFG